MREKLIELLNEAWWNYRHGKGPAGMPINFAEHLIANGVTVQKQDGCDYCQEDAEGCRKMFGAFSIVNPFHGNKWYIDTMRCMPKQIYFCPMCGRKLAEPPKEDEA